MNAEHEKILKNALKGLSGQALQELYRMARIRRFGPNDDLMPPGNEPSSVFIILSGTVGLIHLEKEEETKPGPVLSLPPGSWLGDIGFTVPIPVTHRPVALEESICFEIPAGALSGLHPEAQIFLLKRMNDMAATRFQALAMNQSRMEHQINAFRSHAAATFVMERLDLTESETIRNIIQKVPHLPVFTVQLAQKLIEDKVSFREVTETIQADPALVGIVMKSVNSAYYNYHQQVSSIHRAIMLLGFNKLYQLLISEGIRKVIPDTPVFRELHDRSIATAHIAHSLSMSVKGVDPVQIATIATLKELGRVVTHFLILQNPKLDVLIRRMDTAKVGTMLLSAWNLPEVIWKSVLYQNHPMLLPVSDIPKDIRPQVLILFLSDICFRHIHNAGSPPAEPVHWNSCLQSLGIPMMPADSLILRHVLPGILKQLETYPEFFRIMIKNYI